jgi:hypothetical protein
MDIRQSCKFQWSIFWTTLICTCYYDLFQEYDYGIICIQQQVLACTVLKEEIKDTRMLGNLPIGKSNPYIGFKEGSHKVGGSKSFCDQSSLSWIMCELNNKIGSQVMEHYTRTTDLSVPTDIIAQVIRIPFNGQSRSDRLANYEDNVQRYQPQVRSTNNGLVRESLQQQTAPFLHLGISSTCRCPRCFYPGLVKRDRFILCSFCTYCTNNQETSTGENNQSDNCTNMGSTNMVATNYEFPTVFSSTHWNRFCEGASTQCRAIERQMEISSGSSRFSEEQLHLDADNLRATGSIQDSTDTSYGSHRRQFRDFMIKRGTQIDVLAIESFLMTYFYRTRSGKAATAAVHALKQRARVLSIQWLSNLLAQDRILDLTTAMKKISPTGKKRHRDPFPIQLLRNLVILGSTKLSWLEFTLVSALIALGLRSMARGGELAALRCSDVTFTNNGMSLICTDKD